MYPKYKDNFKNATLGRRKKIFRKCNIGKGKMWVWGYVGAGEWYDAN